MRGEISHLSQVAYLRRYTLTEGGEAGLRMIEIDNGKLRFLLSESRALDIAQLWHEGVNVGFLSKNGLTAREIPFLNRFEGGMLYTCGLDSLGAREGFELHGSLHNTPARILRTECDETRIIIEAETRSTQLFGRNLVFKRRVSTEVGSDCLEIEDTLENRGTREEPYCLLYHVNLGYPMLSPGTKISGEVSEVAPRTPCAEEQRAEWREIAEPLPDREETCYFLKFRTPTVSVENNTIGRKFCLDWSADTLPCFVQWKSMACGDYALGLEPCSAELDDRFRYDTLGAGEKKTFSLRIRIRRIGTARDGFGSCTASVRPHSHIPGQSASKH